ncbi:MAG: GNAT family N-acetyltransferase [Myxococcota bacterium]
MTGDAVAQPQASPEVCIDAEALERFLDLEFDGTPGVAREFPLLVAPRNPGRSRVLREGGEILSHAAWRPLELVLGTRRVHAAGVGLVTTAVGRRGCGLAARVISSCLEAARAEGAEVAVLFGRPSALYSRLGFVLAGRERVTRVDPDLAASIAEIRCGGVDDAARLLPLLERHPLRVSRSAEDFAALLDIPDTLLYVAERGGAPTAYCVLGKGRDLGGVIHEWAGAPEAVEALLRGVAAIRSQSLVVIGPDALAAPVAEKGGIGPLAMFRVLDPEALGSDDPVELFGDSETAARLPLYIWGLDSV